MPRVSTLVTALGGCRQAWQAHGTAWKMAVFYGIQGWGLGAGQQPIIHLSGSEFTEYRKS